MSDGDLSGPAKPFSKASQLARGSRRYHRKVASPKRWQQIIDAKGSVCRLCAFVVAEPKRAAELGLSREGCEGLPVSYHHLLERSQGGGDTESGIVPLGGSGSRGHHGQVTRMEAPALQGLAEALFSAEIAYLVGHVGENWPERVFGVKYETR